MGRERYWGRSFKRGEKDSVGCMSGVLHFFDFHQIQFCTHPQEDSEACKTDSLQGVEAPRNSLELEVDTALSSTPTTVVEDIPIGIRLHPLQPKSLEKDFLSETNSFQGSKTPNLVARLMGLDILPDEVSPRPSSPTMRSHPYRTSVQRRDGILPVNEATRYESGIRSLPDTPRISSARRSDAGPRLSLQLNKESVEITDLNFYSRSVSKDGFAASSSFCTSRKLKTRDGRFYEESRSPSTYAREIVKQVKEGVSRRVGRDITNITHRNRSGGESISPTIKVIRSKTKNHSGGRSEESKQGKTSTPSRSPRLRFLETKIKRTENKDPMSTSNSPKPESPKLILTPSPQLTTSTSLQSLPTKEAAKSKPKPLTKSTVKCRKATCERFTQRPPATSQTARKNCKMPFSNNILFQIHPPSNVIQNPTQTVVCSLSRGGSSQKQEQCYEEQQHPRPKRPRDDRDDRVRTTVTDSAELRYVNAILERTGVPWFSPAHSLDPTLFHRLEHSFHETTDGPLHLRCDRLLLFDLTDEILLNFLKPHIGLERIRSKSLAFSSKQLLSQVRSFPSAKCETDIEGLVGFDLSGCEWRTFQAEVCESIVFELERVIFDSLVEEALLLLLMTSTPKRGWRVDVEEYRPFRAVVAE